MYEMGDLQQGIRPMTLSLFFIAPYRYGSALTCACVELVPGQCTRVHPKTPRTYAMSIIISPAQWGMDFIGKFPLLVNKFPGQFKFAIVIVDYNTKWVEAKPMAKITTAKVKNFLWRNLSLSLSAPCSTATHSI